MVTYTYRTRRVIFGLFFLLVGLAFVLDSTGAMKVSPNDIWPLLLIALGAGTLLNRARRLQVEEDRSAQLAVAEERVRIARELHDIVAHGVSLMTIQIAAARRVAGIQAGRFRTVARRRRADRPPDPERARQPARRAPRGRCFDRRRRHPPSDRPACGRTHRRREACPLPRLADVPTLVNSLRDAGRDVRFAVLGDQPSGADQRRARPLPRRPGGAHQRRALCR